MDTDTDYLLAVAWMNAYRTDPDAAVMIAQEFDAGRIGLEQAVGAWQVLAIEHNRQRIGIYHSRE